jgi:hypothetical protein
MGHQDHAIAVRLGIDLIQLRQEIGKHVVIHDREVTLESRTESVQIILCEKAHGNYSVIGHAITPECLNDGDADLCRGGKIA